VEPARHVDNEKSIFKKGFASSSLNNFFAAFILKTGA